MSEENISNAKWMKFDPEWYCKRYSSILPIVDDIFGGDVFTYYTEKGKKIGHSPNPFFDEKWYLLNYLDVAESVQKKEFQSGFDHYCQEGYKTNSPHWLFDERYYQKKYSEKTNNFEGYINGYDHFLDKGDYSLYSGSLFFNPNLFEIQNNNELNNQDGPYQFYLKKILDDVITNKIRITWFFDEEWYLQTYPEVNGLIDRHVYLNGLHHYLSNERPLDFSPLTDFSEEFYDREYIDLLPALGRGKTFRNGYHHFLLYGFQEGRKPNDTLDLEQYKLQDDVINAVSNHLFINAFECWVAQHQPELFEKFCKYCNLDHKVELEYLSNNDVSVSEDAILNIEKNESEHAEVGTDQHDTIQKIKTGKEPASMVSEVIDSPIGNNNDELTAFVVAENPSFELTEPAIEKIEFVEYSQKMTSHDKFNTKYLDTTNDNIEETKELLPASIDNAIWKFFDEEWYSRKYSDVMAEMKALELDSVEKYYYNFGCYSGHSPNPYFDEEWYLSTYPNVKTLVKNRKYISGFDHYCQQGYLTNSPHWLFSEAYYRQKNVTLTDELLSLHGFANGYDHYLRVGDKEGLSGSIFFDPEYFIGHYNNPIQADLGGYAHYLKHIHTIDGTVKTSWYFDPVWYLENYPDVQFLIQERQFINPLHHYLTNREPENYSPSAWFDETFYNTEYMALLKEQGKTGNYRNGYAHFIDKGIELLWQPSFYINLKAYSLSNDVTQDTNIDQYANIYVHWLAHHTNIQSVEDLQEEKNENYMSISDISEAQIKYKGALWSEFNEEWYLSVYSDTPQKMEICGVDSVQEYYTQIGAYLGHSPNPYFDEEWYIHHHESVRKLIEKGVYKTGFEHYCHEGFTKYQPHWLFSPDVYLYHNPQFAYDINRSDEYVNAYDHYLKKGDALRKTGSLFFDPLVYERYCYESGQVEKTFFPYRNYLLNINKADRYASVSLYFDTRWYLKRYPEVQDQIEAQEVSSALQHYFMNSTPTSYDPLPWFSEQFYVESYSDLAGAIVKDSVSGEGSFRNAYDHFIRYGSLECRNPHPDINLREYFLSGSVRDDIENGLYRDAFAHWIFDKRLEAWIDNLPEDSHYRLKNEIVKSREYFRKKAHFMLPTVAHQKLDFSYEGKPDISVVMLVKNQLAVTLTALASLRANYTGKIQLLIGDNHSTDDTRYIQNSLIGAQITRFAYNFGYGRACNYLIEQVQAPITVFLNNDIYLYPGAINVLCKHLLSKADIGAVGGKIIHPNGNLQEAGSIIWRDGTTTGYLRGDDPSIAEANFVRDVDYCSTAMLAIKTILLKQLQGFSPIYYPAYFEDTDLCVRIVKEGYRVVYHPDAVVEHMEYASSDPIVSSGLIRRNHRNFVQTHADFLRFQHPRHSDNMIIARQREGNSKRILFIEDRIPLRRLGSGYVRSNDIIHQMADLGYNVTLYPINGNYPHLYQIYSDIPETVEVLFDKTIDDIRDFFFERAGYFDAIWIGRTHNLNRILPMMGEANRYLPQDCLVLDTEVIAAPRTILRNEILGLKNDDHETLQEALEIELSCARHCQTMITVNKIDADYAKQVGFNQVSILGHMVPIRATPKTWEQRKDFLFVGALHDDLSPNFDSLQWFVSAVLPILVEKLEEYFSITIAGYVHSSVDMSVFARYPQVKLLGPVEDLTHLYNNHRVYIAPTRFAGGIPYKLHEAASFGIPIVAAELLVKQLGWDDDKEILAASINEPEFFATQMTRLYQEEKLWNKLRNNALSRIDTECNEQKFKDNLQQILTKVISHK